LRSAVHQSPTAKGHRRGEHADEATRQSSETAEAAMTTEKA
jgi:hypothetical protein